MTEIVTIITNLGFPIAVCLACFWYINNKDTNHREEINKLSEAVQNNTLVMQKLLDKLGGDD